MSGLSFLLLLLAAAVLVSGLRAHMYAAQALVLANFTLFAVWWLVGMPLTTWLDLGFRPGYLTDPGFAWATLLTAMFVHAGPLHLLMNMLVLLLLGAPFEERIGARRLLIVFFVGGLLASMVLTLVIVPLCYTILDDARTLVRRMVASAFGKEDSSSPRT